MVQFRGSTTVVTSIDKSHITVQGFYITIRGAKKEEIVAVAAIDRIDARTAVGLVFVSALPRDAVVAE